MGKFKSGQTKDRFFTKKTLNRFQVDSSKNDANKHKEQSTSGSFFVTTSEKRQILQEREFKRRSKSQAKPNDSQSSKDCDEKPTKKPFDKKKWRLQKYSNKYKLEKWEEKRKKAVLNQYYKQVKNDKPGFDVQKLYEQYKDDIDDDDNAQEENENNLNRNIVNDLTEVVEEAGSSTAQTRKKRAFKKAHLEYKRIQEEKLQRKEEMKMKREERAEALKQYKQNKLDKYKKLNKKTKKGQPIMKYRMEMLLEQIQKSVT